MCMCIYYHSYLGDMEGLVDHFDSIPALTGIPFQGPSTAGCIKQSLCWNDKLPGELLLIHSVDFQVTLVGCHYGVELLLI